MMCFLLENILVSCQQSECVNVTMLYNRLDDKYTVKIVNQITTKKGRKKGGRVLGDIPVRRKSTGQRSRKEVDLVKVSERNRKYWNCNNSL